MDFRKEDIVLILPPRRWKENRYSLGLLYVSAALRESGFDNVIIERGMFKGEYGAYDFDLVKELIIRKVKELKPKIVGFTVNVQEFDQVIEVNNELKKSFDFISIIGGPQCTSMPGDFLTNGFDVAVVGEGEETTVELVGCLKEIMAGQNDFSKVRQLMAERLKDVLGISYLDEEGSVAANPSRPYSDIAEIVLPAYDKIDMESYVQIADGTVRGLPLRSAIILTSRGCPYDCTFCDCNKVFGQKVRFRSLENVRQEVKFLKERYDVEAIWLADDTFTLNKDHILGIGKIMKEFGIIWSCNTRVNLIDEELVKEMKKFGCVQFDIGVESGSQRVLDEVMRKRISLDQVKNTFALCRKFGMRTLASFMIGVPTETREEMEETMNLAREIKANFYVLSIFTPLPGSSLFDTYYKNEITQADYKDLSFFAGLERFNKSEVKNLKELNTKWRKELAARMKKENLIHVFFFLKMFLRLNHKKDRMAYMWNKIRNMISPLIFKKNDFKN